LFSICQLLFKLREIWSANSQEKVVATRSQILRLKCTKFDFGWGFAHRPRWGSLQRSPRPLARFKGPTSKGREGRGGEGKEGDERGGEGKEGEGREGVGTPGDPNPARPLQVVVIYSR